MEAMLARMPGVTQPNPCASTLWDPEKDARNALKARERQWTANRQRKTNKRGTPHYINADGHPVAPPELQELHEILSDAGSGRRLSAAAVSRLGPREESVEIEQGPHDSQEWCCWDARAERARWLELLPIIELSQRKITRFAECGKHSYVYYDLDDERYYVRSNKCKLRVCPTCRLQIQRKQAERIRLACGEIKFHEWQFVTLTMRHTSTSLVHQLNQLRQSFRKLRQRALWKKSVERGYAVIEIGWNAVKQEWHPHLHIVCKTRFVDWSKLRSDWKACTFGSDNIDCRWVQDKDTAIIYACEYLGKPPHQDCLATEERATEYYQGLNSARMLIPFGNHPKQPEPASEEETKPRRVLVMSLTELIFLARQGYQTAVRLYDWLHADRDQDAKYLSRMDDRKHAFKRIPDHDANPEPPP